MNVATSPLVAAYLADLDRALAGAEPADRLEIVDAVREHIDASLAELGASPTQAEVAGVLRRLGTADDVASAWAVGADRPANAPGAGPAWVGGGPQLRPSAHGLVPIPPDAARPATSPWVVALVVILGALLGVPLLLGLLGMLLLIPVRTSSGAAGGGATAVWWIVTVALVVGTVVVGLVGRRSRTHRRAWLAAFVAGLVLVAATLYYGLVIGGSVESGVHEGPVASYNAPTPSPGAGGIPLTIP